ncbi:MAG: iron-containing alcohol dehydrogenase [Gammaproteobacteria bacterium]
MAKRRFSYPRVLNPASVTLGRGCLKTALDDEAQARVAVMVSGAAAVHEAATAALPAAGADVTWLTKPAGEPDAEAVAAAGRALADFAPSVVLAVGGGSVLDWARLSWAAGAGLLDPQAPVASLSVAPAAAPSFVLVPTTCATGAESATVAVMMSAGRKCPVVADAFMAHRVFLDPQFIEALSQARTALFLCDAASHAIEAFVSIVPNRIARETAASALGLLRRGFSDTPDSATREQLMLGSYFAGAAASHLSVGLAHAFAHTAARYGVSHALGNALALPATARRLAAAGKLDELAAQAGFGPAAELVAWVEALAAAGSAEGARGALDAGLGDAAARADFVGAMRGDVCMRTTPLRLAEAEVEAFVAEVVDAA